MKRNGDAPTSQGTLEVASSHQKLGDSLPLTASEQSPCRHPDPELAASGAATECISGECCSGGRALRSWW